MLQFVTLLHVMLCFTLILIILLQPGKESAAVFGGGGGNQMFGPRGQAHLLGKGRLIERVGLPHVAIGAQPSPRLAQSAAPATGGAYLRSSSGVLFFEEMVISPQ